MRLLQLFQEIKDENLNKDQLESYHKELSSLYADMQLRMGEIEKEEAIYLDQSLETTAVMASRKWAVTEHGQEQIELKRQIKATEKIIASVKSRLYNIY